MLPFMDQPDGIFRVPIRLQPFRGLDGHNNLAPKATSSIEAIDGKFSYATKIITTPKISNSSSSSATSICHGRESVVAEQTTHNGMPTVIFKASDYYGIMAIECKLTIVGRFLKPRPQIDRLTSKFKELISVKGCVKIGVYDMCNVFLDFTNEEDFNSVWYKRVIEIEGQQMWLQKWSPDFKPDEELPMAPVWILLPGLPFHMHT